MTTVNILHAPKKNLYLYDPTEITELLRSGNRIYGELGRGLPATINTAEEDSGYLKGKFGEAMIGSMLNILALENSEMFIFHSVANPDGYNGETDHVLLFRDKIILIETKTYSRFSAFRINATGQLRGVPLGNSKVDRKLNNNDLIVKMGRFSKAFPNMTLHAITAVSRSNVITASENGKYKVASLDNLTESLSYHQEQATAIPRSETFRNVGALAKLCFR